MLLLQSSVESIHSSGELVSTSIMLLLQSSVESIHSSGELHQAITDSLDEYLTSGKEISQLLERLVAHDKKLFLISNSGFPFM